jgi:hypothetical protein
MKQMWIGNPEVGASAYTMLKEGWDPLPMGKLPIGIEYF